MPRASTLLRFPGLAGTCAATAACLICLVSPQAAASDARTAAPSSQFAAAGVERDEVLAFLALMRNSLDDPARFAALVAYPVKVTIDGARRSFEKPSQLIAQYDRIVTPRLRDLIRNQAPEQLIVRADGIGLGDGELWFSGICADTSCRRHEIRITTIQAGR